MTRKIQQESCIRAEDEDHEQRWFNLSCNFDALPEGSDYCHDLFDFKWLILSLTKSADLFRSTCVV